MSDTKYDKQWDGDLQRVLKVHHVQNWMRSLGIRGGACFRG